MNKIGILYGMERSFPEEILKRVNNSSGEGAVAEFIKTGPVNMHGLEEYAVILDRVSHEVPFYRAILKLAALNGSRVVNNPFWNAVDDNFFQAALAKKLGASVPKTVVLPSKNHPYGTSGETMQNLKYPIDWDEIFEYVGFPAFIKPNLEHTPQNDYKIYNKKEFFAAYGQTGSHVMILQENIDYSQYFRCYVIGMNDVKIMAFDPRKPNHLRFPRVAPELPAGLENEIQNICKNISASLGLEFNAVEIAIKNDRPVVIDLLHPAPTADPELLKQENFDWLAEHTTKYLLSLAKKGKRNPEDYNWRNLAGDIGG